MARHCDPDLDSGAHGDDPARLARLRESADCLLTGAEAAWRDLADGLVAQAEGLFGRAAERYAGVVADQAARADRTLKRASEVYERTAKPIRRQADEWLMGAARAAMDHGYQIQDTEILAGEIIMDQVADLTPYAALADDRVTPPPPPPGSRPPPPTPPPARPVHLLPAGVGVGAAAAVLPALAPPSSPAAPPSSGRGSPPAGGGPTGVCADPGPAAACIAAGEMPVPVLVPPGGLPPAGGEFCGTDPTTGGSVYIVCRPYTGPGAGAPGETGPSAPPGEKPPPETGPCDKPPACCVPTCPTEPPAPPCEWVTVPTGGRSDKPPPPYDDEAKWTCTKKECAAGPPVWECVPVDCTGDPGPPPECAPAEEPPAPPAEPPEGGPGPCSGPNWGDPAQAEHWRDLTVCADIPGWADTAVNVLCNRGTTVAGALPLPWWLPAGMLGYVWDSIVCPVFRFVLSGVVNAWCYSGCDNLAVGAVKAAWVYGLAQRWTGLTLPPLERGLDYTHNECCPNVVPDAGSLVRAWLIGQLDTPAFEGSMAALGYSAAWAKILRDNEAARMTPDQYQALWQRDQLSDGELAYWLGLAGVRDSAQQRFVAALARWIPGPTDLIRFMMRDTFDSDVVAEFHLDDEFGAKFTEDLSKLARSQGVDESTMRHYWRAHWDWPSPTQLYEMLHRLRPGRPHGVAPVTIDDVARVLGINDVAPVWRERLIAISYTPIERRRLKAIYCAGYMTTEELIERLQDRGLTEDDARLEARLYEHEKLTQCGCNLSKIRKSDGYKAYRDGLLNRSGAENQILALTGCDPADYPEWHQLALRDRQVLIIRRAAKRVERSIHQGRMTAAQGTAILLGLGLDLDEVVYHQQLWELPDPARPKEATMSQLCQWLGLGLVTEQEFFQRARAAGYSTADALRIVGSCEIRLSAAAAKAAQAQAKREAAAANRRRRPGVNGRG